MISSLMYPISWLLSLSCDSFDMRLTSQARYDLATKLSHRCYNVLLAVNITMPLLPWQIFSYLNSVRKLYVRESYAVWGCSGYGLFYIQVNSEMLKSHAFLVNIKQTSYITYFICYYYAQAFVEFMHRNEHNTVWCCYNAVNFLHNPHNRHPIACPIGCFLCI